MGNIAYVYMYGPLQVPMSGKICEMLQLCGQLAAAVVEVLEDPSCQNSRAVHELVSS
jgi:hypothetical protein